MPINDVNIETKFDSIILHFATGNTELQTIIKLLAANRKDSDATFNIYHQKGYAESAHFIKGALLILDVKEDNICITPTPMPKCVK